MVFETCATMPQKAESQMENDRSQSRNGGVIDFENDAEMLDVTLHGIAAYMARHGYPDSARAVTTAANKLKSSASERFHHEQIP
jgi:hypothetical protein